MFLVPNISPKDYELAIKNLKWQKELDDKVDFDCLLAYDEAVPRSAVEEARDVASSLYRKVSLFPYPTPQNQSWPAAPNYVWQSCARFIAHFHKKLGSQEWLFLEADAIPISKGWLGKLALAYKEGKKPFMGHVVDGMGHFNGVAVYPHNVAQYVEAPLMISNVAWDVVLGDELKRHGTFDKLVSNCQFLIMHVWAIDKDGKPTNDASIGTQATFKSEKDVWKYVDMNAALFHRNKDGTLIDWLHNLKQWKDHPELINVPIHAPIPSRDVAPPGPVSTTSPVAQTPAPIVYTGRAEILIVTYWKDSAWLDYCLRAMRKYLTGFSGITVVVPRQNSEHIRPIVEPYNITLQLWDEAPGKGMLDHMVQICNADHWCAMEDIVVHFDPDCIFHTPTTVDEYVQNGKPVMLRRSYSGMLTEAEKLKRVVSDCYQWKKCVEEALGFVTDTYTMCRHPSVHPTKLYYAFRDWIQQQHNMEFREFVLSKRNEFPQTFAEFPTLGAFAWEFYRDDYIWIDLDKVPPPKDMQKTYWSHGGITEAIRNEIEGFLR